MYEKKFHQENYAYVLLKSMIYFNDADPDPMPLMIKTVTWLEVKEKITKAVTEYRLI